ncbi:MAG: hypothetical protein WCG06_06010, partial [Candidatus Omnitrophota bacterium]
QLAATRATACPVQAITIDRARGRRLSPPTSACNAAAAPTCAGSTVLAPVEPRISASQPPEQWSSATFAARSVTRWIATCGSAIPRYRSSVPDVLPNGSALPGSRAHVFCHRSAVRNVGDSRGGAAGAVDAGIRGARGTVVGARRRFRRR